MKASLFKIFVCFFFCSPLWLTAQTTGDWQGLSENGEPVNLKEIVYKDKSCFRLDGKNEAVALHKEGKYRNFRIDLDMAGSVMSGVGFHVKNEQNYQFIYFRPGYGNTHEAIQYVPVYNGGLSWVLYHHPDYEAKTNISQLTWFHVAIEVRQKKMKVFVNHKTEPEMSISLIDTDVAEGGILLRSMFGESYFSDVRISELPQPMTDWEISEQLPRDVSYDYSHIKKIKSWRKINMETDEMVNLKRYFEFPNGTVFARRNLNSSEDKSQILYFDFTGKLKIVLNGKEVFNYAKYKLDRLNPYGNGIIVDLKKGDNELLFIIEGDAFFFGKGFYSMGRFQHQNWGFTALLEKKIR